MAEVVGYLKKCGCCHQKFIAPTKKRVWCNWCNKWYDGQEYDENDKIVTRYKKPWVEDKYPDGRVRRTIFINPNPEERFI